MTTKQTLTPNPNPNPTLTSKPNYTSKSLAINVGIFLNNMQLHSKYKVLRVLNITK